MTDDGILKIMREVRRGRLKPAEAVRRLDWLPFEDLEFARLDVHRGLRKTVPEVVFCQGKTVGQAEVIILSLLKRHGRVLATRAPEELAARLAALGVALSYDQVSRALTVGKLTTRRGVVGVMCAGKEKL